MSVFCLFFSVKCQHGFRHNRSHFQSNFFKFAQFNSLSHPFFQAPPSLLSLSLSNRKKKNRLKQSLSLSLSSINASPSHGPFAASERPPEARRRRSGRQRRGRLHCRVLLLPLHGRQPRRPRRVQAPEGARGKSCAQETTPYAEEEQHRRRKKRRRFVAGAAFEQRGNARYCGGAHALGGVYEEGVGGRGEGEVREGRGRGIGEGDVGPVCRNWILAERVSASTITGVD